MNEMVEEIMLACQDEVEKAISHQLNEYLVIRAGRANPHILDRVFVDYYGVPTPIKNMASITVPEARILAISVWDQSQMKNISKAISMADLGVTPNEDGKIIRLIFPMLTEERRKDLVKQVKVYGDETKVVVRNNRRDAIDKMRAANKKKELTDDLLKEFEEKVQKITDKFTAEVDKVCETKNKELMEI